MSNQKIQKPTLTGQRFKTRKRDEKKVFDPTQFQETIVQGLNQTGSDLDAVAKFLDASGAKLDYRRYAETLFDILVAGGMLAPGGTLSDDLTRTEFCLFTAQEDLETMQAYAQVFNKLIRRYKYLEKGFEEEIKKLLLFLKGFTESERNKLAMLTGILLANGNISASILNSLYNENLVKEGVSAAFAVKLFKSWIHEKDINSVAGSLRKVGMDNRLLMQEYCYDNIHFMNSFQKIVVLLYKADVLSEEAILKWYTEAHVAKGRSVFLEQMKKFVEWLKNAEEESESEEDEAAD
uniref:W2 domain-containing protein n=1 Tax=Oncorhynchus tshawytscha TaxID=74940 RepID=A0AAZ3SKL5_ONCTS